MARSHSPARIRRSGSPLQLVTLEDRITPVVELVSVNAAGTDTGDARSVVGSDTLDNSLSADGRFVVFNSLASNLTADPDEGQFDIYVRDTVANKTTLVTKTLSGKAGAGSNQRITPDGRYVTFVAGAVRRDGPTGYVPAGTFAPSNGGGSAFRFDRTTGEIKVATVRPSDGLGGAGGVGGGGLPGQIDVSDDGNLVVFTYTGTDLIANDTNGAGDIFVRDFTKGTTTLVNRTPAGGLSGNGAADPIISGNGKTILFRSVATDLTAEADANKASDLYAYDVATGKVELVTIDFMGKAGGGGILGFDGFQADIDGGGTKVVFFNDSTTLVDGGGFDPFSQYLYLRDLSADTTTLVSRLPSTGMPAGVGTGNGGHTTISQDGRIVAFQSGAPFAGVPPMFNSSVFLYDTTAKTFEAASRAPDGKLRNGGFPLVSGDGRYVTFTSNATDLVPGVTREMGVPVYVYDRLAGQTFAISTTKDGKMATQDQFNGSAGYISLDGSKVAFNNGQTLGFTDTNAAFDAFINDVPLVPPNAAPTISDVPDQKTTTGLPTPAITFTVGDAETPADKLTVAATSGNTALIPAGNVVVGGAGANRTVTVTPAAGQNGTAVITLTVTDAGGKTATDTFTVTVAANTPPTITDVPNQTVTAGPTAPQFGFTVGDAETAAADLKATATATNGFTAVVTGTGVNRTVEIQPPPVITIFPPPEPTVQTTTVTLTVTDAGGLTAADTFTLTVNPPGTVPTISDVANQATKVGTAVGPVAFTVGDAETAADKLTVQAASGNPTLVPADGVVLGGAGANRTVTVTPAAGQAGTAVITLTVIDAAGRRATDTFTVTVDPVVTPVLVGFPQFAAGDDKGAASIKFYNPDKSLRFTAAPFGDSFTGGVRTAAADFDGDGVADVVAGTGPGRPTQVVILNGKTQAQMFSIDPFEATFKGGVYVSAGDVTGDGVADLVITPDEGGGPRARVFSGKGFGVVADFFGISDPNFRGGARSAIGDVNGDGTGDLVVAAGFQGGPRVAVFNGKTLGSADPVRLFNDFFAFEQTLRNGVFIAAGDIDGDGKAEVIAGGGPGGGPRVTAFSAKDLISSGGGTLTPLANFFGGDPNNRGGVRVAVKNLDSDNRADIVVGSGSGAGSRATAYLGKTIAPAGTPPTAFDFDTTPGFAGGIFVG